ncbi:MAG: DUF4259 domain-containing protein [Carbonactinosporaceae bacterium]
MGTWGTAPFDNDDAMDFFGEIEDFPPEALLSRLRATLTATAERPGHIEVSEANVAVAAAALVAAGRSRLARAWEPAVDGWLTTKRPRTSADDHALALRALDRVAGPDSEWMELWGRTSSGQDVRDRIDDLRKILCS